MIFNQHALLAATIELPVKNLFPGTQIEPAARYRYHNLTPHDLPLNVRIGIVFTRVVMAILIDRRMGRELL